ncbi:MULTISPECIES: Uma2 family endonuclease [Spirulina sp. CCY15215]|uniref:Uma2 family endonuclease n=1 Tax=Spirulina sp. CCY15215 TaxID=2767591 RepID=UPI00194F1A4D|nr:Uma2 family endonuclease [Spirulina major]
MTQITTTSINLKEFLQLPETTPPREFIQGHILPKPMPQGQHSRIQQKLIGEINRVAEGDRIALALPELRCTFGGQSTVPDIAIFTWGHLPILANGNLANTFTTAPDWTIEILSPQQPATRVTRNIFHCLNHGTQLGWLIDPGEQLILTYKNDCAPGLFEGDSSQQLPVPNWLLDLFLTPAQIFGWLQVADR